jgi:hypothetical protein
MNLARLISLGARLESSQILMAHPQAIVGSSVTKRLGCRPSRGWSAGGWCLQQEVKATQDGSSGRTLESN